MILYAIIPQAKGRGGRSPSQNILLKIFYKYFIIIVLNSLKSIKITLNIHVFFCDLFFCKKKDLCELFFIKKFYKELKKIEK